MQRLLIIFGMSLFLLACFEPTIDTSSDNAFKDSVKEIKRNLSSEEKKQFDRAMLKLTMRHLDLTSIVLSGTDAKSEAKLQFKQALDGKTAAQIIDEASTEN